MIFHHFTIIAQKKADFNYNFKIIEKFIEISHNENRKEAMGGNERGKTAKKTLKVFLENP